MLQNSDVGKAHLNVDALYTALDTQRRREGLTWRSVAQQLGVSASTFTRLKDGRRPDVDSFAAMVAWLGVPSEEFFVHEGATPHEEPQARVSYLRAKKDLDPKTVEALEELLRAAEKVMKSQQD